MRAQNIGRTESPTYFPRALKYNPEIFIRNFTIEQINNKITILLLEIVCDGVLIYVLVTCLSPLLESWL